MLTILIADDEARLGSILRAAIEAWPEPARVALIGVGGRSHWMGTP